MSRQIEGFICKRFLNFVDAHFCLEGVDVVKLHIVIFYITLQVNFVIYVGFDYSSTVV